MADNFPTTFFPTYPLPDNNCPTRHIPKSTFYRHDIIPTRHYPDISLFPTEHYPDNKYPDRHFPNKIKCRSINFSILIGNAHF